jgi:mannose-6-phosphate isomerase
MPLLEPLAFQPSYQRLVWGGRRMRRYREDLPEGPIGESWDLADHEKGMSRVRSGEHAGRTLRELMERYPDELVGPRFRGQLFPLMIKLIDASDTLSVQVHPDDELARELGVGDNGKTECWFMLEDGGTLYQGTRPGVDRGVFEAALAGGRVAETLNQFAIERGDFFFLEARTVHALGSGCLLYEIQQTSDVTFRVYDWGRVGLDGKPRPLHVEQSLATIDFSRSGFGALRPAWQPDRRGGETRRLADCRYFEVEQRRTHGEPLEAGSQERCSVVICSEGRARIVTQTAELELAAMTTALVPATAGSFRILPEPSTGVLVATPRF